MVEYKVQILIGSSLTDGTVDTQYLLLNGTFGEGIETACSTDFAEIGSEVSCTIENDINIGGFMCIKWRSEGSDNLVAQKV